MLYVMRYSMLYVMRYSMLYVMRYSILYVMRYSMLYDMHYSIYISVIKLNIILLLPIITKFVISIQNGYFIQWLCN